MRCQMIRGYCSEGRGFEFPTVRPATKTADNPATIGYHFQIREGSERKCVGFVFHMLCPLTVPLNSMHLSQVIWRKLHHQRLGIRVNFHWILTESETLS